MLAIGIPLSGVPAKHISSLRPLRDVHGCANAASAGCARAAFAPLRWIFRFYLSGFGVFQQAASCY
jgi:hypothetical protein